MLGWESLLSVLYLGVAATGVAYLLYFGLIAGAGASKAVLVTYLVPSLALVYGAVFLDETVTAVSLVGLALVLTGVALGTGTVKTVNRYWPMLLVLAAVWGASYLFIKVAVDEIEPAPMMAVRTLLAAAVLLGIRRLAARPRRRRWRSCAPPGATASCSASSTRRVPFWLIAWGEQHIDSGLAAVVQASVPIFNALLVLRFLPHERLTPHARARARRSGSSASRSSPGSTPSGGSLAILGALAVVALLALVRERRRLRTAARSPARRARSSPPARCSRAA